MTTSATPSNQVSRHIARIVPGVRTLEGGGFVVRRPFPTPALDHVDPFLLLDEMGPVDYDPGASKGAPDHPHRGFETVTYLLSGQFEHRDSQGHAGQLNPGDVQWMTAGAGIVHSEMPSAAFQTTGGRMHGFQIWVNLPARDKMMQPRYQEVPAASIPTVESDDGLVWARVIAGQCLGARAVIDTRTPITYLHLRLQPGARFFQPLDRAHNALAYVFVGHGVFGQSKDDQIAREGDLVIMPPVRAESAGDGLAIEVPTTADGPMELLLLSGDPIGEPIARHGPFVMNTRRELLVAFEDWNAGRLGSIPALETPGGG